MRQSEIKILPDSFRFFSRTIKTFKTLVEKNLIIRTVSSIRNGMK
jgi:hypothetical protein